MVVFPVIQNLLVKCLNFFSKVILLSLLTLLMSMRQDQSRKECYIISIDMELALLKKVVNGLGSDLEVLACFL